MTLRNLFITMAALLVAFCCHPDLCADAAEIDLNEVETLTLSENAPPAPDSFRVIAFNIKYGLYYDGALAYLKSQMDSGAPLIILLSEVDRDMARTGDRNIGRELADALEANYAFGIEFIELSEETPETQGVSGNAIITRYPIESARVLRHTAAYDWAKYGKFTNAQRDGGRSALIAQVRLAPEFTVTVVSAHLENRSDNKGRAMQMKEIIEAVGGAAGPVVIGGDLNEESGGPMFKTLDAAGFANAFKGDTVKTGGCISKRPDGGNPCMLKLDWIFYRGLEASGAAADSVLGPGGDFISDHAPVRADFNIPRK